MVTLSVSIDDGPPILAGVNAGVVIAHVDWMRGSLGHAISGLSGLEIPSSHRIWHRAFVVGQRTLTIQIGPEGQFTPPPRYVHWMPHTGRVQEPPDYHQATLQVSVGDEVVGLITKSAGDANAHIMGRHTSTDPRYQLLLGGFDPTDDNSYSELPLSRGDVVQVRCTMG